jgi:hypothetical protein
VTRRAGIHGTDKIEVPTVRRSWSTAAVITLQAVIQVPRADPDPPWPVTALPSWSWLVVDGDRDHDEIGLFVATAAMGLDVAPPATK